MSSPVLGGGGPPLCAVLERKFIQIKMTESAYYFRPVWDILLRILHWWNAVILALQIVTGSVILIFGEDMHTPDNMKAGLVNIHAAFGYLFAAGIFIRIMWLFIGPHNASWRDLLPLTANQRKVLMDTLRYYASALHREPPLYAAHNPFAGIIYAVFFVLAAWQILTGSIMLNLPADLRKESIIMTLHKAGYFFIIFYAAAHVFAVFVHEWAERHGLIAAMVHGGKTFTQEEWQKLTSSEKGGEEKGN